MGVNRPAGRKLLHSVACKSETVQWKDAARVCPVPKAGPVSSATIVGTAIKDSRANLATQESFKQCRSTNVTRKRVSTPTLQNPSTWRSWSTCSIWYVRRPRNRHRWKIGCGRGWPLNEGWEAENVFRPLPMLRAGWPGRVLTSTLGDMTSLDRILAVNRGSSSLKFALYETRQDLQFDLLAVGNLERIGHDEARVSIDEDHQQTSMPLGRASSSSAVNWLLDWVASRGAVAAVGHRVVHGGARYREPALVDAELLAGLRRITSLDPDHLPMEIELMEAFADRFPELPQVACFDTEFHSDLPRVARILPVPRRLERAGVVRYGFHGLSFEYLLRELRQRSGDGAANGRVILAPAAARR